MIRSVILASASAVALLAAAGSAQALSVVQTTSSVSLTGALVTSPGSFSSISVSHTAGDSSQVGTYSGFSSAPITIGGGVVISSGQVLEVFPAFNNGIAGGATTPSTDFGGGSTGQIDGYAPTNVGNWASSHDTSQITISFTLGAPSAVAFDFIFGSVEYPQFTGSYTDAMYAFLDGTQISFDALNNPVQVGGSFAASLTTADTNTAFADPHGLIGVLTTTSGTLGAGAHTLNIAVADTNDEILDSAAFLANFRLSNNDGGPITTGNVPEPATLALLGVGLAGLAVARRRR